MAEVRSTFITKNQVINDLEGVVITVFLPALNTSPFMLQMMVSSAVDDVIVLAAVEALEPSAIVRLSSEARGIDGSEGRV